jgi:predicted RNA-binding protein YlxR (DUF448 family)
MAAQLMSENSSTLVKSPASQPATAKIISIDGMRRLRAIQNQIPSENEYAYHARILRMDKLALLEEMVRFQQERSEHGDLTPEMMSRGRYLFKALEEKAETEELRLLARSYRRHLDHELSEHRRAEAGMNPSRD